MKNSKKKYRVKGQRTPKIFIWILGRIHGKKGQITHKEGKWNSNYITRKEKEFQAICANVWKETVVRNAEIQKKIKSNETELEDINKQLEMLTQKDNTENELVGAASKLRRQRRRDENVKKNIARKKNILFNLPILNEEIRNTEVETEETLLEIRHIYESIITIYLQGASKYIFDSAVINLNEDELAKKLYYKK